MSDMYKENEDTEGKVEENKDGADKDTLTGKDASATKNAGKSDNGDYEDVCFVCRRPESKAGRMFKLPNNICVCDDCMHKTMDSMSQFNYQGMMPPFYDFSGMMGNAANTKPPVQEEKKPENTEIVENEEKEEEPEKKDGGKTQRMPPHGFPDRKVQRRLAK